MSMLINNLDLSTLENVDSSSEMDEVEIQIQRILTELETMVPEVQGRFCSRLLIAIAEKITPAVSGKAIAHAKLLPNDTNQKAATKPKNTKSKKDFRTHLESLLLTLSDSADPLEAWDHFGGADQLYQILREEPEGSLELMLQHHNMPGGTKPRGKTSDALAKSIVQRLNIHFSNQ